MRLDYFIWHRRKPNISVIFGDIELENPVVYICPLCNKVAFESYYNVKTHYWGEKEINGMKKINRIQCKNNKCKAMFTIYKEG